MTPLTTLRRATRAALRRRYGYAALRVLRRALRAALALHRARQLDPRPYSTSTDEIRAAYFYAMRRLRRRWPRLDYLDPRAEP